MVSQRRIEAHGDGAGQADGPGAEGDTPRRIAVTGLCFDGAALAVLALVPLAGPLGLARVVVPASALLGWFFLAVPLLLAAAVLVGSVFRIHLLKREGLAKSAFWACIWAWVLSAAMLLSSEVPAGADATRMRAFAAVAFALYSMNLLATYRPALSRAWHDRFAKPGRDSQ